MNRKLLIPVAVVVLVAGGVYGWRAYRANDSRELVLYGNIDLRQVQLSFNNSDRIAEVLVQEGERVKKGQVLARLDTGRLEPQLARAAAQVAAQRQAVIRLRNGSRPEEIAQARANVDAAKADLVNAQRQYERLKNAADISAGRAVRQQDVDASQATLRVAEAKVLVNQKILDLALLGPRKEDIAENEAILRASEAQAALLRQQLADFQLLAPTDAVVRTRLMEPGEMATSQTPVFALAITDPKWVRAYVAEPDLGKLKPGAPASVAVDSYAKRRFAGWIGFISPVAEFTPKAVQTAELRTSLVYEVRVFVKDPDDELRLGMPASVYLPVAEKTQHAEPSSSNGGAARPSKRQ